MSLRDALRSAVARCAPLGMQHATFSENDATGHATAAQPCPANPHETTVSHATADATGVQQWGATPATPGEKLHVARPSECNTQLGALTAHRVAAELLAAAMRTCDHHGDCEAARDQMRRECLELPPHLQRDLLPHFRGTCCSTKNNQRKSSHE